MKIIKLLLIVSLFLPFFSCEKEDELTASNQDVDLFIREDNPDSEVDGLIYQVYEETGFPILYKDTVGKIYIGSNAENKDFYFYQIIDLKYNIIGSGKGAPGLRPVLLDSDDDIKNGINFVKNYLIPNIPETVNIKSFLLCNSFEYVQYDGSYAEIADKNFHWCISTFAIGNVDDFKNFTTDQFEEFKNKFFVYLFTDLIQNAEYVEILEEFKDYSKSDGDDFYYYDMFADEYTDWTSKDALVLAPRGEYGFIVIDGSEEDGFYQTPKVEVDLESFINAVMENDEAGFTSQYEEYPRVMSKYNLIKDFIFNTIKYKF